MKRIYGLLESCILAMMGAGMLWFSLSDRYGLLMNVKFRPLTVSGAVLVLLLGVATLAGAQKRRGANTFVFVVMLAVGAQKALGAVHPPAVAMAFIWATSGQDDPLKGVGPLIGCAILVVCQQVWLELTGPTPAGKAKKS